MTGLAAPSKVRVTKLVTLSGALLKRWLGRLGPLLTADLDRALVTALGINMVPHRERGGARSARGSRRFTPRVASTRWSPIWRADCSAHFGTRRQWPAAERLAVASDESEGEGDREPPGHGPLVTESAEGSDLRPRLPLYGVRLLRRRAGPRVVPHQERRARHRHDLVAARTRRIHLTARGALEVREQRLTVWTGAEPSIRHWSPFVVSLG